MDAAEAVGVQGAVQVGCDLESSRFTVQAVEADPRLLGAVALHPNDAPGYAAARRAGDRRSRRSKSWPATRGSGPSARQAWISSGPKVTGLAHQRYSFRRHIDIAKRLGLTLQIHDRDAHDDVVQVLREEGAPERVVFHCFSGDEELARICNADGWYMSFAGTMTFKNAGEPPRRAGHRRPGADSGGNGCAVPHPASPPRPAERELHGSRTRSGPWRT